MSRFSFHMEASGVYWKKRRVKVIVSMALVAFLMYCLTESVHSSNGGIQAEIGKQKMTGRPKALPMGRTNHSSRKRTTRYHTHSRKNKQQIQHFPIQPLTFLINEPYFCLENNFLVVIFVCSAPLNFDRRLAIRKTWGKPQFLHRSNVTLLFVLGQTDSTRQQIAIREESMRYRDIIQGDFIDSYKNLTLKSITALKWFSSYCFLSKFMMKTDDDIYVNVPLLTRFLDNKRNERKWFGGCIKKHVRMPLKISGENPILEHLTSMYNHPPFLAGAGYVISTDITDILYKTARKRKLIPVEDAFITGYCAKDLNIEVRHYEGFSCGEKTTDYCVINSTMFTAHHVNPRMQIDIWKFSRDPAAMNCNTSVFLGNPL